MSVTLVFNGSVPANYEKYSGASVFEPYALDIIERIKNDEIKNVLEIACGTGRVTSHLTKLIPEGEVLYATDISADMIAIAKTIVTDNKVKWQLADAHDLPFDNSAFDHVVCQFGVMFFRISQRHLLKCAGCCNRVENLFSIHGMLLNIIPALL